MDVSTVKLFIFLFLIFSLADGVYCSTCSSPTHLQIFTNWTGFIRSPNFTRGNYLSSEQCEWHIRVSAGSRVRLNFNFFELESPQSAGANKCWDYIEILDGPENQQHLLAKKCGRELPEAIISKTSQVTVMFYSDNSKEYKGFEIEYTGVCGNNMSTTNVFIQSPGYPKLPPPGVKCEWIIHRTDEKRPAVEITSIKHTFTVCRHSGLKVSDYPSRNHPVYLCRNHAGLKFPSGHAMYITYHPSEATRITQFSLNVTHVGLNPCQSTPCKNEASCLDLGNGFSCLCPPGITGSNCEFQVDECASNPCVNGGYCRDYINGFVCNCPHGYTGVRCEELADKCQGLPCYNGGRCMTNENGTLACVCVGGYVGKMCENRVDGIVVGLTCDRVQCKNGGTCVTNRDGLYRCKCPPGVMGPMCEVVTHNGCRGNPCAEGATCVRTEDNDDESESDDGQMTPFKCLCPEGRTGLLCQDYVNSCLKNECHNGGKCVSIKSDFYCNCTSGWRGRFCEHDIDECQYNPCQNGGRCENTFGGYACECQKGFKGRNCSTNINDCSQNACQNGGSCIDLVGKYKCKCLSNYWGKKCQHKRYPCHRKPCKNGGECVSYKNDFVCECAQGFTGRTCSEEINPCTSQPCKNNGSCQSTKQSIDFYCKCPPGFLGTHCELKNECFPNPCHNGGRCLEQLGTYSCKCRIGFEGAHCEVNTDNCKPNPCTHGGRCEDLVSGFRCWCAENYKGKTCLQFKYEDLPHCAEETDDVDGSGITWFATRAGHVDTQPCPPGVLGNATRKCYSDLSSTGTKAVWGRPDLAKCVHKEFLDIQQNAEYLLSLPEVSIHEVTTMTRRILNITRSKTYGKVRLYPGDLAVTADTCGLVADVINHTNDHDEGLLQIVEEFGETIGSIVDPAVVPVWRNANPTMVSEKMSSILANSEKLAGNVFRRRDMADTKSFSMSSSNVDFTVTCLDEMSPNTFSRSTDSSRVSLPKEVFEISRKESYGKSVALFNARYSSMGQILSFQYERPSIKNDTQIINSDILTSSMVGIPAQRFSKLSSPIILVFKLKDESLRGTLNDSCVYMNMEAKDATDRWKYLGCYLAKKTATHTECHCYHLTNFALLMDLHGIGFSISETHQTALSYISYIGGALSILGCVLSLFTFEYFRLTSDRVRIHENLAISIILVQLIFLIGINRKDSPVMCKTVAILLHYAMMSMFCWMLVEGIHLYIVLVKVFRTGSHLKKYALIGWGLPLIIVGIPVGLAFQDYGQGSMCWMTGSSLLILFVPTVALVILLNTIVLAIVIRVMLRSFRSSHRAIAEETSAIRVGLKATAVLLPLLGLTWTFGFLSIDACSTLIFTYIFTILNCLQGLFFFVFHCMMNIDVRNAIKRKYFGRRRSTLSAARKSSVDFDTYGEYSSGGKKLVRDPSTSKSHRGYPYG